MDAFGETLLTLKIYSACNVYYRFSVQNYVNSVSLNAAYILVIDCKMISNEACVPSFVVVMSGRFKSEEIEILFSLINILDIFKIQFFFCSITLDNEAY